MLLLSTGAGTRQAVALIAGLVVSGGALAQEPALPRSTLAVRTDVGWEVWWSSATAPAEWPLPDTTVLGTIVWRRAAPGVEWGEARLSGPGEAKRIRVILARLDPQQVRFRLDTAYTQDGAPAWSIARAGPDAFVAINAGQFPRARPWGWVVLNGREYLGPGVGPLSTAIAIDSLGRVRWIPGDSLHVPLRRRGAVVAFQSYPTLLEDGVVPLPLRASGRGVNLRHRDARAAIGQDARGRILIALTRFDGAGGVLDFVPFGLTVPEMTAVMGAVGARDAVMLDGGISSQLLIRDSVRTHRWRGLRRVPLGLLAVPR